MPLTATALRLLKKLIPHLPAVIVFSAGFAIVTWPLVLNLGTSTFGSVVGDGWKTVEQFWWYKHAIIDLGVSPLYDPNVFYPQGWYTATSSHSLTLMLPTIPLTVLFGPITAYNLTMWWSFVFAALGVYVLIYYLTNDRLASILGGISYAFCMSRLLRAAGHLNVSVGSAWIPWIFVCLEISRRRESRRWRFFWSILAGGAYACSMLSYWYFVYLVAVPLAAYFAYELWRNRRARSQLVSIVGKALITFGVAGILVAPLILVTFQARAIAGVQPFAYDATTQYAASPEHFVLPNRYNPIWGNWVRASFPDLGEQDFVFLGLTTIALAGLAVVKRVHPRVGVFACVALVSTILALGPALQWNDKPIELLLPGFARALTIPLPGALLYRYAPMFNAIRVWARFSLVTSAALGVLAGLAVAHLQPRLRWGRVWVLGLIAIVALESIGSPFHVVSAKDLNREVDRWLATQPGQFAVMELPLNDRLNGSLMYSRMLHDNVSLATGYTAAVPAFFLKATPEFNAFPNQKTVNTLKRWKVRYLLYTTRDPAVFRADIAPAIARLQGLTRVGEFGGYPGERVYVYEVSTD